MTQHNVNNFDTLSSQDSVVFALFISRIAKRGGGPNFVFNDLTVIQESPMADDVYFCGGFYGFEDSFEESVAVNVKGKTQHTIY